MGLTGRTGRLCSFLLAGSRPAKSIVREDANRISQGRLKSQNVREDKNRTKGNGKMKIDVSTIEGYESMSAEEKLNAVLGLDFPDAGEMKKLKDQLTKANSEAKSWKDKHNALLSDDERKANENAETLQTLQTELETLRKEKAVSGYKAKLLENGFLSEEADKGATALAEGDIDGFFSHLASYRTNMEKSIKADLQRQNPKPGSIGGSETTMTREKFNKLSMHEQMVFMAEHPDEYKAMKK